MVDSTQGSTASTYTRRVVDEELDDLLASLSAVSIDGPKGVGKTATASQRAETAFLLDDPATVEIVRASPERVTTSSGLTLVDEWQRLPETWDVVRRAVDADPSPGRFLLTGSASPDAPTTHSGAGRVIGLRMRPMTLPERGVETPTVSLGRLLSGGRGADVSGATSVGLTRYADEIVRGGFPGVRHLEGRALRAALRSYVERIVDRDVPEAGLTPRNPALMQRWLAAYAAATSTTASYETIRDASSAGSSDKPAKSTTIPYLDALQRIWVVDPVRGWLPTNNHLHRLTAAPKHHLADPALAVALTNLGVDDLLDGRRPGRAVVRDGTFLGALFESLVALSVRVFAQTAEADVFHLRTRGGGHEVDFVVVGPGRRVLAIEVKLARSVTDDDVKHLHWLSSQLGPDLVDAVVVTTGPEAYRRSDGIAVVPAALLGP